MEPFPLLTQADRLSLELASWNHCSLSIVIAGVVLDKRNESGQEECEITGQEEGYGSQKVVDKVGNGIRF